jgi:hypothetical protein
MGWTIPELDRSLDKYFVTLIPEEEEEEEEEKVRDSGLNPAWSLVDNLNVALPESRYEVELLA